MKLHHIFPTAIGKFELGRNFTEKEMQFLLGQETRPNMGNLVSTDSYILNNEILAKIKEFAESSMQEFLAGIYAPSKDVSLRITQSWLNYTKPGQFHHKHAHPNSFLSGVLYIKTNKDADKIYFYKTGYQQITLPTQLFNLYNSDSWWFEAVEGELLVFPSSLTHSVETVVGDDQRVSLSFNTFPVGYVGDELSLTATHL